MENILKNFALSAFLVLASGCGQAEILSPTPAVTENDSLPSGQNKSAEKPITKLMAMERRDKLGNIIGLNDEGLWYKRGEIEPYTGIVAGYYKAKEGKEPIMASMREYKAGIQVGTETNWYNSGKKRIELTFNDDRAIFMRQWDADGKELKQQ